MSSSASSGNESRTWRIRPAVPAPVDASSQVKPPGEPAQGDHTSWTGDANAAHDVASRLVAEFFERRDRGERPAVEEYNGRFPASGRSMAEMVRAQEIVRSLGGKKMGLGRLLRLPEVGDELFGFRLRFTLGSGAFARVFVAEQADLACRKVVLKISAIEGSEPQTLARLQHTNIVPIHSVHENQPAGLRAVCMPYLGGASLSAVLERLWAEPTHPPTRGAQIVAALEAVSSPSPEALHGETSRSAAPDRPPVESQTPRAMLSKLSYEKAVAWIVAQLAEGLHHAHQRGILHRDIKPSNILLSCEGQPLLLDFNVAQEMSCDSAQAMLGGTVAYAAPEHLRALLERTPELIHEVDQRSDIYSLGLVFAEMLTGERIFEQTGSYSALPTQLEAMAVERGKCSPSLRMARPDIPWGLESIARKCLDPDPGQRYQRGDQLAEDLRRFMEDRPLKSAPELSQIERAQKFLRRNPRLAATGPLTIAALVLLTAVGGALLAANRHLACARAIDRKRAHDAGTIRALCLVNTTLGRQDHLRQGIEVCEQTLALYNTPPGHPVEEHPDWSRLPPADRRQLAEDRRELILLLAGARVRVNKGDPAMLHTALKALDEAEAIHGLAPSKALWLDRASYCDQLGDHTRAAAARTRAEAIPASTARDYYLLATAYVRQGDPDAYHKAITALNAALRLNPRHYWSAIERGICHMELGESALAASDFGICIGLWPEHPWGYFNRGYVLDRSGLKADAVADYTTALEIDPNFVEAVVNRGLARLELKAYESALADFDRAIAIGQADAASHAGRGIALEALGRHREADVAFAKAFDCTGPADPARTRLLWTHGFAIAARLPNAARVDFDEVLLSEPRHPQALYGQAMLAMSAGQLDSALQFFDRALEVDPGFDEARRFRAVVLARIGQWDRASRDINWCLERTPRSGETVYAAACVAARAAGAAPGTRALDQAFDLLERALKLGAGQRARTDPDLSALRDDPRFAQFLASAARNPATPLHRQSLP